MNSITPRNETEAFLLEEFQSLLDDLDTAGDNAQYGHVLDDMDDYLFLHGRIFLPKFSKAKSKTVSTPLQLLPKLLVSG